MTPVNPRDIPWLVRPTAIYWQNCWAAKDTINTNDDREMRSLPEISLADQVKARRLAKAIRKAKWKRT